MSGCFKAKSSQNDLKRVQSAPFTTGDADAPNKFVKRDGHRHVLTCFRVYFSV